MNPDQPTTERASEAVHRIEDLAQINASLVTGYLKTYQACTQGLLALQQEFMRFIGKRVECDLDMTQSLAKCRSWEDLTRLQQDWSRAATEDYTAESSKVMQLAARTANQGFEAMREQSRTAMPRPNAA